MSSEFSTGWLTPIATQEERDHLKSIAHPEGWDEVNCPECAARRAGTNLDEPHEWHCTAAHPFAKTMTARMDELVKRAGLRANRNSAFLLLYMAELHPGRLYIRNRVDTPLGIHCSMSTLRGLERRGWAREHMSGLFEITSAGLEAARKLKV